MLIREGVHTGLSRHLPQERLRTMGQCDLSSLYALLTDSGFLKEDGSLATQGFRSMDQGTAPYIYAAFDPELPKSES